MSAPPVVPTPGAWTNVLAHLARLPTTPVGAWDPGVNSAETDSDVVVAAGVASAPLAETGDSLYSDEADQTAVESELDPASSISFLASATSISARDTVRPAWTGTGTSDTGNGDTALVVDLSDSAYMASPHKSAKSTTNPPSTAWKATGHSSSGATTTAGSQYPNAYSGAVASRCHHPSQTK